MRRISERQPARFPEATRRAARESRFAASVLTSAKIC
jgi:hypothetical protein